MSKVEMSLQEYDEMREELRIYKEIVDAVTTPKVSDWNIQWYDDHPEHLLTLETEDILDALPAKHKEIITSMIARKVDHIRVANCIVGKTVIRCNVNLGYIEHIKEEKEEE